MRYLTAITVLVTLAAFPAVSRADTTCAAYLAAGWWLCDDFDTYCMNPLPDGEGQCPTDGTSVARVSGVRNAYPRTSVNYHTGLGLCGATMALEERQSILNSAPYGGRMNNMGDENGDLGQGTRSLVPPVQQKWGTGYDLVLGTDENPLVLSFTMSGGLKSASGLYLSHGYLELALEQTELKRSEYLDPEVTPTDYIMVGGVEVPGEPGVSEPCLSCFAQCQQAPFNATDGRAPHAAWPTICQSYEARLQGSLCPDPNNPGQQVACPPPFCIATRPMISDLPGPVVSPYHTLAIGALAMLDPNPCHCENPPKPEACPGKDPPPDYTYHTTMNHHLAFFDGWKWRILGAGHAGPAGDTTVYSGTGDFIFGSKYDTVKLTVKTNTVDIYHKSRKWVVNDRCNADVDGYWEDWKESWAENVPRKYLGEFNVLRLGNSPSCKLCSTEDADDTTSNSQCPTAVPQGRYECQKWAGTKCHNMTGESCVSGGVDDGSNYVSIDTTMIIGGEPGAATGACCLPSGGCTDGISTLECVQLGGHFRGANSVCGDLSICRGACCQTLGACEDNQLTNECTNAGGEFKGEGTACTAPDGSSICTCHEPFADVDWDGDVDQLDFAVFQSCFTGYQPPPPAGPGVSGFCKCFDRPYPSPGFDHAVDASDLEKFELCASGPGIPVDPNCDQ